MQGLTGRLFREFALIIAGAVIISTFIALSLTAMLSSRLLKKTSKEYKALNFVKKPIDYLINN
jgi:multidrug efflux pump